MAVGAGAGVVVVEQFTSRLDWIEIGGHSGSRPDPVRRGHSPVPITFALECSVTGAERRFRLLAARGIRRVTGSDTHWRYSQDRRNKFGFSGPSIRPPGFGA